MLRFLLGLLLLTLSTSVMASTIDGIRLSQSATDTRLVFDLSDKVKFYSFILHNPERLVIDFQRTSQPKALVLPNLSNSLINNIRYATRDNNTLRVVLDLNQPTQHKSHLLAPSNDRSHRLVVDFNNVAKTTTKNKTTTPKITKPILQRDIVIAIDAGHGGNDAGATGRKGTKEKDIVLAIAIRLAKLVDDEVGMRAYLVRDNDTFVSLRQRKDRARAQKADMFISIHADAFHNSKAKGASVYVLSERGASSEAAQMLADKENAADLVGGISLEDKDDLLVSVLLDLSQTASLEASLEVANTVLSGLKRVGHTHKKRVGSASFVVLKSPDIPSILIETAFISNPAEERKLNTASHQKKLARAMMSGIRNYFQRNPLPGTTMANSNIDQQHIVSNGDTLSAIAQRYQVSLVTLKSNNALTSNFLKVGDILSIP